MGICYHKENFAEFSPQLRRMIEMQRRNAKKKLAQRRKRVTWNLDGKVADEFKAFCEANSIAMATVVEDFLYEFMKDVKNENTKIYDKINEDLPAKRPITIYS